MLTATSEGTIFMIPLTKSWLLLRSELGPSPSCLCTSISFPLSSGTTVDGSLLTLLTSGLGGNLDATSTPLISSNFSSNWLQWQWKGWDQECQLYSMLQASSIIASYGIVIWHVIAIAKWPLKQMLAKHPKTLSIPNKVNIYWAHCASEDYPVSSLGIINSLIGKREFAFRKTNLLITSTNFSYPLKLPHQDQVLPKWYHVEL